MKFLIGVACIAVIAGVGLYFYRDHQAAVAAQSYAKERNLRNVCRETQAGRKWDDMKQMNGFCKEQGYIE